MAEMGYDGEKHLAQPCTQELMDWADLIVCMSHRHANQITKRFEVDPAKVTNWEVVDPFHYSGDTVHRKVAQEIKEKVFLHFLGKQN